MLSQSAMSYCLSPDCLSPKNEPNAASCQSCGTSLVLRDRYRAQRLLGRGGFGATFLAQDESLPGQPICVIKQMQPPSQKPSMVDSCRQLFQREANTLGKLSANPQITRLLDFFEHEGEFYLVQEYVDGVTLNHELKHKGPFSESKMKTVLKDLLHILHYLHSNKVIHRDIKPANIMHRKFDGRLVLIDFGGVKDQMGQTQILEEKQQGALTQFALGTIGYAPAEQLSKRPVYASDIYSLGATCFFLLTAKEPAELEYDPQTGELIFPTELKVSEGFQSILRKMLAESVRDRYKSAKEVFTALKQLETGAVSPPVPQVSSANQTATPQPAPASDHKLPPSNSTSTPKPIVPPSPKAKQMAVATLETPAKKALGEAIAKVSSKVPNSPLNSASRSVPMATDLLAGASFTASSSKHKKQTYPWWNRPLIGDRSLTQRLILLFRKEPISERALQIHQKALDTIINLSEKALTVDSEKFGNDEFLAFVRIQYALGKGHDEYADLTHSAELLRVGVKAKNSFLKIEQIEVAYRGPKQNAFYDYIQDLLTQNLNKETFLTQVKDHVQTLVEGIKSKEGKASLQSYTEQLEILSEHEFGLKLLSLFKQHKLSDYSVLRAVSDMVNRLHNSELFDLKSLIAEVASQAQMFEKLGNIIGLPPQKRDPETYAKLLQYLALSEKYQSAYDKFQELVALLEDWQKHREIITTIRKEYSPKEYKYPKEFRVAIPGQDIYDKYGSYFALG